VSSSRAQILRALAQDRFGIAVSSLPAPNANVKQIALALENGGTYYPASPEHLADGKYPLARTVYAYINRSPTGTVNPKVQEFLRYILSRDGQSLLLPGDGYRPLPAARAPVAAMAR
jgi:phosphate transport system substrate-binding protein